MVLNIVVTNQLDTLSSPSIRLSIASNIGIKHHVLWCVNAVHRPVGQVRVLASIAVGVQIVNKGDPTLAHEVRQLSESRGLVGEGVNSVSQTIEVVEHKRHFLEVGDVLRASRDSVEAVGIGRDVVGSPDFARLAAVSDEDFVTEVSG